MEPSQPSSSSSSSPLSSPNGNPPSSQKKSFLVKVGENFHTFVYDPERLATHSLTKKLTSFVSECARRLSFGACDWLADRVVSKKTPEDILKVSMTVNPLYRPEPKESRLKRLAEEMLSRDFPDAVIQQYAEIISHEPLGIIEADGPLKGLTADEFLTALFVKYTNNPTLLKKRMGFILGGLSNEVDLICSNLRKTLQPLHLNQMNAAINLLKLKYLDYFEKPETFILPITVVTTIPKLNVAQKKDRLQNIVDQLIHENDVLVDTLTKTISNEPLGTIQADGPCQGLSAEEILVAVNKAILSLDKFGEAGSQKRIALARNASYLAGGIQISDIPPREPLLALQEKTHSVKVRKAEIDLLMANVTIALYE